MKHTAVRFLSFASAANIINLCTTHRLPVPPSVNIPAIRVYGSISNKRMILEPAPIQGHVTNCSIVDSTLVLVITSSASPEIRGKDFIAVYPMVIPLLEVTDVKEYQAFNLSGVNDYLARKPMLVELTAEVELNN